MSLPRPLARLVARAKPRIPDALWPTLLSMRSVVGGGPVLGLPAVDRVLALVPHPDDETFGCGGTLACFADAGTAVHVVAVTDGEGTIGSAAEPAETGRRRRREFERAVAVLAPSATTQALGLPDGALGGRRPDLVDALRALLDAQRPDVVLAPWLGDGHADHHTLAFALADALRGPGVDPDLEVWGYETWTPLTPNRFVDVTAVHARKEAAARVHETAALALDVEAFLGLGRWRSLHATMGRGHVEAFLAADVATYQRLAAELAAFDPASPHEGSSRTRSTESGA